MHFLLNITFLSIFFFGFQLNNLYGQHKPISLFDKNLTQFDLWLGVPHSSVDNLPSGTYSSENVHQGIPIGLNNNVKNVFSTVEEDGELLLKISGEIYGGLTTKKVFSNYHLSVMFKWGEKKWAPRLTAKRDSGILYHCYGKHGRFWKTWKTSLEYQVQERDLGDFIPLGGNSETPKVDGPKTAIRGRVIGKRKTYDPESENFITTGGYIDAHKEVDAVHGQWNLLEIYVVENDAVHVVNGEIVMVVENAINPETGKPMTSGQIQIQSEAAECYYKNLVVTPIKKFPRRIRKQIRFK